MENAKLTYEELKSPVTAQLEVTYKCNNRCSYCYNSWRGEDLPLKHEMSKQDSLSISKKLADAEIFEVILTGGEPLLRRDIVYPCAKYLASQNIDVGLNTNLILLNEEDCDRIRDVGISRVFSSLSSFDEKTYNKITRTQSFNKAVKGLETLVKSRISVGVNMVVTQENKDQVYETGRFLHNLGIKFFSATPASPCDYMPREIELSTGEVLRTLDDLLQLQKEFGMSVDVVEPLPRCITKESEKYEQFFRRECAAGKITIAISPSGMVRPCTHVSEEYGNLINENLKDIWLRMKSWRAGKFVPSNCFDCAELEYCSLGCREAGKINEGDYKGMDPWAKGSVDVNRKKPFDFSISENEKLRLVEGLRFRKEEKGYFIFSVSNHSALYANDSLFKLMSLLANKKNFTLRELSDETKDSRICNIVNFLKSRGLII